MKIKIPLFHRIGGTNEVTYTYLEIKLPSVKAHSHLSGKGTGYLDISWEKVQGATGYQVGIYNGVGYDYYNVGDVSSWLTKNKGIWPSEDEIESGSYRLHNIGDGEELYVNPSKLYKNAFIHVKGSVNKQEDNV